MKDKVKKIREEVERLHGNPYYMMAVKDVLEILDMQEEPVSMWHDASEEPKPNMELICVGQYGNPLVLSSNSDSFKERYISKWAYFNDLLNLSNAQRTTKDFKDTVSEDLEVELNKYIKGHFTIDREQLDRFGIEEKDYMYSMDKSDMLALVEHFTNWQKTKDESTTEDLGEYINELSNQFPEVSFAKLSRIAVRVAKWQKEQIIKRLCNHANIDQMVEKYEYKYKPKKVLDTEYYKRGIFDTIKTIKED